MNIFVTGINHKTAPLEVREKLSFNGDMQKRASIEICKQEAVDECILFSTCNRTEAYIYSGKDNFDHSTVEKLLCDLKGENVYELKKYFYTYKSRKAVKHLFNVASGLDSQVFGEDQILGQIKGAYEAAMSTGTSSVILNTLFRHAVTSAKKIKTNTSLSMNSVSTGSLAVKLASDMFEGELKNKCVLIIGMGKIGRLTLRNLLSKGVEKIYVTNRTHGKSEELARESGKICVLNYGERYSVINESDVIISSTSSPHYTITGDMVERYLADNKTRVFIDLAVPRDIDTAVAQLPGVKYFNMDSLQDAACENFEKRLLEGKKAEQLIDEFVYDFEKWYHFRDALPVIKDIQRYASSMANDKISHAIGRLKNASDEDKEIVKASVNNIVNSILNRFIYSVRENNSKEDVEAYFRCLGEAMKDA